MAEELKPDFGGKGRESQIEEAVKAVQEQEQEQQEGAPEDEKQEQEEEEENSELFDAAASDDAAAADDDDADGDEPTEEEEELFEEGDEKPKTVPYKRLSKVIGERNGLRDTLAEANSEREALREVLKVYSEGYKDNPKLADFDVKFMESMESLAKQHPHIATAAAQVKAFMENGRKPTVDKPAPQSQEATRPVEDARVSKIIQRDAERTIDDTLSGLKVKPSFRAILKDHITAAEEVDLAELGREQVVELSKQYFKDKGLTSAEVLEVVAPDDKADKPKRPPTSRGTKAAAVVKDEDGTKSDEGGSKGKDEPKDRDEWQARREARMKDFFTT